MIFFFRAWCATPFLTRGMDRSLRLEEAVHAREVGRAHEVALLEPVLPLARLLGEDVAVVGVPTLQLARPRLLEPLHGGPLGLLLRHFHSVCAGLCPGSCPSVVTLTPSAARGRGSCPRVCPPRCAQGDRGRALCHFGASTIVMLR